MGRGRESKCRDGIPPRMRGDLGSADDPSTERRVQGPKFQTGGECSGRGMGSKEDMHPHLQALQWGMSERRQCHGGAHGTGTLRPQEGEGPRPGEACDPSATHPSRRHLPGFSSSACAREPPGVAPFQHPRDSAQLAGDRVGDEDPHPQPPPTFGDRSQGHCPEGPQWDAAPGAYHSPAVLSSCPAAPLPPFTFLDHLLNKVPAAVPYLRLGSWGEAGERRGKEPMRHGKQVWAVHLGHEGFPGRLTGTS